MEPQLKTWPTIDWLLRATVALQCLGLAYWFLWIEETPLLSFLWGQPDIGGLGWSEAVALGVQHAVGWAMLVAAGCVWVGRLAWVGGLVAAVQLAVAVAMIRVGGEYQLPWRWLPVGVAAVFPLAAQAARVAAPLGLVLVGSRREITITVLRVAIVVTFVAHGIEAWTHYFKFIDDNIIAAQRLVGWQMSQATSETLLTAIGCVDFLVAALVATTRWPAAIYYMVLWGFVTAASRIVVHDWELGWHEFATRAAHFGLPLVVALYWRDVRSVKGKERREQNDEPSN
jgi:hypothetical protein